MIRRFSEDFYVVRKVLLFALTLYGKIIRFEFGDGYVTNDVEVWGHGILLSIHSGFEFPKEGNKVKFFLEYNLQTSNPFVRSIANKESKVIMTECSRAYRGSCCRELRF